MYCLITRLSHLTDAIKRTAVNSRIILLKLRLQVVTSLPVCAEMQVATASTGRSAALMCDGSRWPAPTHAACRILALARVGGVLCAMRSYLALAGATRGRSPEQLHSSAGRGDRFNARSEATAVKRDSSSMVDVRRLGCPRASFMHQQRELNYTMIVYLGGNQAGSCCVTCLKPPGPRPKSAAPA